MDNPQHPDPSQELPPPPEEKLLTAHAGNDTARGNTAENTTPTPPGKSNKWQKITWAIIAVIILEFVSIYFLRTDNDIKFLQSFLGVTPTSAPTTVPTHAQPSPTSLPTPTEKISQTATESGTICTTDVKQCPDGSYVGRTGPKCEFVCK